MHIRIHIFPERLRDDVAFELAMEDIQDRIRDWISRAVISSKAAALGNQTFLNPDTMEVAATVNIYKGDTDD